jgi:hypothetical protein
MSHLINIFLDPAKVFADLKDYPRFMLPAFIIVLLSAALMLGYHFSVDPDWYTQHLLAASGKDMSAAELEQAQQFMPGARAAGSIGAVFAVVMTAIVLSVMALYFMLAGKITGNAVTFRHGLALTAWSSLPAQLGTIVALIGVLTMSSQTDLNSLKLTFVDPLLVELPYDHAWSSFAKSIDLLTLWSIFLAALGWRIWGRTGWGQAITVALLPSLVVYGGWAGWLLLK